MRSILVAALAAPASLTLLAIDPAGEALPAPVAITGPASAVTSARAERITDPARWADVWGEHLGPDAQRNIRTWHDWPEIDFNRYMVLAFFRGTQSNTDGVKIESWQNKGDHVLVRYDDRTYQTFGFSDGGRISATPYAFFILPRSAKELRLEENVQHLLNQPPVWKETHRLPAMPE